MGFSLMKTAKKEIDILLLEKKLHTGVIPSERESLQNTPQAT